MGDKRQTVSAHHQSVFCVQEEKIKQRLVGAIVHELLCMLDLGLWEHAASLASIYRYVMQLLARANMSKRQGEAIEARRLLADLGDAFRQASLGLTAPAEYAAPSTQFSVRA